MCLSCLRNFLGDTSVSANPDHLKSASGGHLGHVAFGATMLASAALHNIFATYYLDFFLSVVRVNHAAFYGAQLLFLAWNAVNDLLFGWLSDRLAPMRADGRRNRLPIIRVGGLLWCVAFCMVWWPWTDVAAAGVAGAAGHPRHHHPQPWLAAANFAFVLCFYDAMLTLVEVSEE